jgi:hypothetical protein
MSPNRQFQPSRGHILNRLRKDAQGFFVHRFAPPSEV